MAFVSGSGCLFRDHNAPRTSNACMLQLSSTTTEFYDGAHHAPKFQSGTRVWLAWLLLADCEQWRLLRTLYCLRCMLYHLGMSCFLPYRSYVVAKVQRNMSGDHCHWQTGSLHHWTGEAAEAPAWSP
jgi:hypothetical protein